MTTFHEYVQNEGHAPAWPYEVRYDQEQEIETDVLVIGGGIAGCWAAISAARTGVRVALVEKAATVRSGAGGPGCDHWCDTPSNPLSFYKRCRELTENDKIPFYDKAYV